MSEIWKVLGYWMQQSFDIDGESINRDIALKK